MRLLLTVLFFYINLNTAIATQAGVFTQPLPDTEKFVCKFCPEVEEPKKSIEAGIGFNTSDEAKANEFNGLEGNHVIPQIDARYTSVSDEGKHLTVWTQNLGDASREISISTGEYGNYEVDLNYDQITRFQFNDIQTPFSGVDTSRLSAATGNVKTNVSQERYQLSARLKKVLSNRWETIVNYRLDNKSGLRLQGAALGSSHFDATSITLPVPIEYTTHYFNIGLTRTVGKFRVEGGYKTSVFKNANSVLTWDDPNQTRSGRIALAPENQHHQIYGLAALRFSDWFRVKGQFSVGRILQDESFAQYTINSNVTTSALPRDSLGGKVDTLAGNMRINMRASDKLTINANFHLDRKDNKTPQSAYSYVILDSVSSNNSRTNKPLAYTTAGIKFYGDYRFAENHKLNTGYKARLTHRRYSEVSKTLDHQVWISDQSQLSSSLGLNIKLIHEQRSADDYKLDSSLNVQQHPLMRKYYLAERLRNKFSASSQISATDDLLFDVYVSFSKDDYSKSDVGLTESTELAYGVDSTFTITEDISLHAFASQERLQSNQVGVFTGNWQIDTEDTFTFIGLGLNWSQVVENVDLGFNYKLAMSRGLIESSGTGAVSDLPEIESDRHTMELFARYAYDEYFIVKAAYFFEMYDESDWHVDDISYNSVSSILGLGQQAFSYNSHFIAASVVYRF